MQYMFRSAPAFAQSLESWPETTSTLATNWYGPTYEMFNGATAFRSKFSCPSGNYGPPVKCTCTLSCPLSDSVFTTQIDICLQASPVHGLCSDSAPKYGAMPDWDVSEVTNMSHAFRDLASFDADLSKWEVSQVTAMEYMFHGASSFSSDISAWDTSRVTNMQNMFHGASSFRSSVSDWKGAAATSTQSNMFLDAEAFVSRFLCRDSKSGPASTCAPRPPPSPLTDASFYDAVSACTLEAPVSGECITYGFSTTNFGTMPNWDVQYVTDMSYSFKNEPVFDGDISSWNTSSVTSMREMFHFATSFNRAIGGWNTSKVTDIQSMFSNAQSFNQPLNTWDTSSVTTMYSTFANAQSFNQPLHYWDTSSVLTVYAMFDNAWVFDQNLKSWKLLCSSLWRYYIHLVQHIASNQHLWVSYKHT